MCQAFCFSKCLRFWNFIFRAFRGYNNGMLKLWKLEGEGSEPLCLPDMSSLDAVTHSLPGGFYSTFRTFQQRTRVLGLRAHLDRLYRPAASLRLQPAVSSGELRRRISMLLSDFPVQEARVRVILSAEDRSGSVYLAVEALHLLPDSVYRQGVRTITMPFQRQHPA